MKKLKKLLVFVLAIVATLCFYACNECPHEWTVVEKTDATCVSTGLAKYECSLCSATKEEILAVSPNAHDWKEIDRDEPTCAERGRAYYKCDTCENTKDEILPIDENAHTYGTEWENDYTHHWKRAICQHTTVISTKESHTFENGECFCGADESECIAEEWNALAQSYVAFTKTQYAFQEGTNLKIVSTSGENSQLIIINEQGCYYKKIYNGETLDEWVVKNGDEYYMYYFENGVYVEEHSGKIEEEENSWKNESLLYEDIGAMIESATVVSKQGNGIYTVEFNGTQVNATFVDGKLVSMSSGEYSVTISYEDVVIPQNYLTEWTELFNAYIEFAKTQQFGESETNFVMTEESEEDNYSSSMTYYAVGNAVYGYGLQTYEEDGQVMTYEGEMWLYKLSEYQYAIYEYAYGELYYGIENMDPNDFEEGESHTVFALYDFCIGNFYLEQATLVEKLAENKFLLTNEEESIESAIITFENGKIVKIEIDYKYSDRKDYVITISYGNAQIPRHPDDGHNWSLKETVQPTCGEYGKKVYDCSLCEDVKYEMFGEPTGEHSWKENRQDSTCKEHGWVEKECDGCDAYGYYSLPKDETKHVYGEEWDYDAGYHWKEVLCSHGKQVAQKEPHEFKDGVCEDCGAFEDEWEALIASTKEFAQTQVAFTAGTNLYIQTGDYFSIMVTEDVVYYENEVFDEENWVTLFQKTWIVKESGQFVKYVYNPIDKTFGTTEITTDDERFMTSALMAEVVDMILGMVTDVEKVDEGVFQQVDQDMTVTYTFVDGILVSMHSNYNSDFEETNSFTFSSFEVPSFEYYALVNDYLEFVETQPAFGENTNYKVEGLYSNGEYVTTILCANVVCLQGEGFEYVIIKTEEVYDIYLYENGEYWKKETAEEQMALEMSDYLTYMAQILPYFVPVEKVDNNVYLCKCAELDETLDIYVTFENGKISKVYAEGYIDDVITYGDAEIPELPNLPITNEPNVDIF